MKEQIETWVDKAITLGSSPNEALSKVAAENIDKMNPEIVQRMSEMYNIKSFLAKQAKGADLEEPFPVADHKQVCKELFKKSMPQKKTASAFSGIEHFRQCVDSGTCAFNIKIAEEKVDNEQLALEKNAYLDNIEYAIEKIAEYVKNITPTLASELVYLYPKSYLLKKAGLDSSKRRCPNFLSEEHKLFEKYDKFITKLAEVKSRPLAIEADLPNALQGEQLESDYFDVKHLPFWEKNEEMDGLATEPINTIAEYTYNPSSSKILARLATAFGAEDLDREIESIYLKNTRKLIEDMKRKAIFETIVKTDPQISNANPSKMLSLFETLTSISPRGSLNPNLVRQFLRSSNSIGGDMIDAESLIYLGKTEKALKDSDENFKNYRPDIDEQVRRRS